MRNKMRVVNIENKSFELSQDCLRSAIENGTYTILIIPETIIEMDDRLIVKIENQHFEGLSRNKDQNKRLFIQNISSNHQRKRPKDHSGG